MIQELTGTLRAVATETLAMEVGPLVYQVMIPELVRRRLQGQVGQSVRLHTIEYLEGNAMQGRLVPRMLGFLSDPEREFFELLCEVEGLGVRKAMRVMAWPVPDLAAAICENNVKLLTTLPGVGAATAEKIVSRLRKEAPKFALMVPRSVPDAVPNDLARDAIAILVGLGHNDGEARQAVEDAVATGSKCRDVGQLIELIYSRRPKR